MSKTTRSNSSVTKTKRESLPLRIHELMKDYILRIDLDADYQREKVWTRSDQELLLDSIIKEIDIPKLYLAKVHNNEQYDYECIDGKQRLLTLLNFLTPDGSESTPLRIDVLNKKYTFEQLQSTFPQLAQAFQSFTLDFVVYDEANLTDSFVREIFRRLQLGIRLNSGEILNSQIGTIRDFVFKEMGNAAPFLRNTHLSEKRYSRQFTLAQICINSFHNHRHGKFVRARLTDLEDFFAEESSLRKKDVNLERIRKVLRLMDDTFGQNAQAISSRAVAVSAYLFTESLFVDRQVRLVPSFVNFYTRLLDAISEDMDLIASYQRPRNKVVLEEFQKYVLQASVEPYSISRRHTFLMRAFEYFRSRATKGRILGAPPGK